MRRVQSGRFGESEGKLSYRSRSGQSFCYRRQTDRQRRCAVDGRV